MTNVQVQIELLTEYEGVLFVRGFAFGPGGAPVELAFADRRNGRLLQGTDPLWYPRPEVAAVHSLPNDRVGFRVTLETGAPPGSLPFDLHELELRARPRAAGDKVRSRVERAVDRASGSKAAGALRRVGAGRPADATTARAFDLVPPVLDTDDPSNALVHGFLDKLGTLDGSAAVLEIGSRARSGITRRSLVDAGAEYVGIDVLEGPNVDLVGDAHRLSELLPHDHFTHAFAISVWEHLLSPWKVSLELNAVLQMGAEVMIGTHQSWPVHDEPSDYWRFSKWAWKALFNEDTGFEVVESAMGIPGSVVADVPMVGTVGLAGQPAFLSSSCIVRKVGSPRVTWDARTDELGATFYPA